MGGPQGPMVGPGNMPGPGPMGGPMLGPGMGPPGGPVPVGPLPLLLGLMQQLAGLLVKLEELARALNGGGPLAPSNPQQAHMLAQEQKLTQNVRGGRWGMGRFDQLCCWSAQFGLEIFPQVDTCLL